MSTLNDWEPLNADALENLGFGDENIDWEAIEPPKRKPIKTYELYQSGAALTCESKYYRSGDKVIKVKAKSIKQAYWLAGHGVRSDGQSVGIVSVQD